MSKLNGAVAMPEWKRSGCCLHRPCMCSAHMQTHMQLGDAHIGVGKKANIHRIRFKSFVYIFCWPAGIIHNGNRWAQAFHLLALFATCVQCNGMEPGHEHGSMCMSLPDPTSKCTCECWIFLSTSPDLNLLCRTKCTYSFLFTMYTRTCIIAHSIIFAGTSAIHTVFTQFYSACVKW